jgi:hypothetical protein
MKARGKSTSKARSLKNRYLPVLESCESRLMMASDVAGLTVGLPAFALAGPSAAALQAAPPPTTQPGVSLSSAVSAQSVLDSKVVPFDLTTTASLTFNLGTGSYFVRADITNGVSYDTDRIKELFSGNVTLPRINPVEALSAFYGLRTDHTSNYAAVRQQFYNQYGAENVYFVSERFSEWASPETLGAELAKAVATAGSSTASSVKEAFNQIRLELNDIYEWAKVKSQADAPKVLADVVQAIVLKQDFNSPYLAVKWVNIDHSYRANISAYGVGTGATVKVPHFGFALIWKTTPGTYDRVLNSFNQLTSGDPTVVDNLLKGFVNLPAYQSNPTLAKFLKLATTNPADKIDTQITSLLKSALGLDVQLLRQRYAAGNPVVDLTGTPVANRLAGVLSRLALGNEGSASVVKLEFNLGTLSFNAEISLRHRHSWGSVGEIIAAVGKKAGEWATKAGDTVSQWTSSAGNLVRDTIYSAGSRIKEEWLPSGSKVKEWLYYDAAGQKLQQFRAWSGGQLTSLSHYTTAGWKDAAQFLDDKGEWVSQTLDSAGKVLKEWLYYDSAGQTLQKFRAWSGNQLTSLSHYTTAGWRDISQFVDDKGEWVSQTLDSAGKVLKEWLYYDSAGQKLQQFRAWSGNQLTSLSHYTTAGWRDITKFLSSKGEWVSQTLDSAGKVLKEWLYYDSAGQTLQKFRAWSGGKLTTLNKYVTNGVQTLEAYISTTGNWVEKSLSNGVVTAVRVWNSAGTYLGDQMKNFSDAASKLDPTTEDWWPF